jgi:hypothetical protein
MFTSLPLLLSVVSGAATALMVNYTVCSLPPGLVGVAGDVRDAPGASFDSS